MHEDPRLEKAVRLARDLIHRPARDRHRRYRIEGIREFIHAADSAATFDLILHCPVLVPSTAVQTIIGRLARKRRLPVLKIGPERFRQLTTLDRAAGIIAIARQEWARPDEIDPQSGLCWLACESIRSAGNLGTILRTAEAVGAAGLWCVGDQPDPFDPACVRATMGGLSHLRFVRTPLDVFGEWVVRRRATVVGLDAHAGQPWTAIQTGRPTVLAIGDERTGLSAGMKALCNQLATLPQQGHADSLNVAVATGVMLYELVRQRAAIVS